MRVNLLKVSVNHNAYKLVETIMDLKKLSDQISNVEDEPPFHLWNPEFCGDMDLVIKKDGSWWYMGSPIGRIQLVKLFAKVLIQEGDEFFLKTPAEKIRIKVEDAPFIIVDWQELDSAMGTEIEVTSNLGRKYKLGAQHPVIGDFSDPEHPKLYVELHRNLLARVHRNVYYQWVEFGQEKEVNQEHHIVLSSGEQTFSLGKF